VLFREPLKPAVPALAQESTLPFGSVSVMVVLLKLDWMKASPAGTFFFSRFRVRVLVFRSAIKLFPLLLGDGAPPAGNGAAGAALGARVGSRALTPHRQSAAVPYAAVAVDLHQPLDVLAHPLAQLPLHHEVPVDVLADTRDLVVGQLPDLRLGRHRGVGAYLAGDARPDAEDIAQRNIDALIAGDVHSSYTSHAILLPLPLLVARVTADHAHHPAAAHDLAVVTTTFDRCRYFHGKKPYLKR